MYTIVVSPQANSFRPCESNNAWPSSAKRIMRAGRPGKNPRRVLATRIAAHPTHYILAE